jgi:threonine aldolase
MKVVDLRSDTVTQPTPEMREAMCKAEVGDDVYGEDPTVNRLQEMAAQRLGKEAALFVASGTMGNLAALLTHCGRGDEVIAGDASHTILYEQGGVAALGGIMPRPIPNQPDGTLLLEDIERAIRPRNVHTPRTRLLCLENTHNTCGGIPLSIAYTSQAAELARERGIGVHLDGARIFNAAVALEVEACDLAKDVDSVMFCLSKGLCAPVGSVLCGTEDFIAEARRARKVVGGGMRQAGILAAAGVVALEQLADRLGEDHARAKRLAEGLAEIPGVQVAPVYTNIVFFTLIEDKDRSPREVEQELAERGVLLLSGIHGRYRAVTHYWIDDDGIELAIKAAQEVLV